MFQVLSRDDGGVYTVYAVQEDAQTQETYFLVYLKQGWRWSNCFHYTPYVTIKKTKKKAKKNAKK